MRLQTALVGVLLVGAQVGVASAQLAVPDFLGEDVAKRFPKRTQRGLAGEVFLTATGGTSIAPVATPPEKVAPDASDELVVVDDSGERVRVVATNPQLRLALYLPRSTLRTVALAGAALVTRAGQPVDDRSAHVEIVAGVPLTTAKPGPDGWLSATYEDGEVAVTGLVPADKVGPIYTPNDLADTRAQMLLRGDARVYDGAQGKLLARFKGPRGETREVERDTIGAGSGYRLVRYSTGRVRVVGWVRDEDLVGRAPPGMRGIIGHGSFGGVGGGRRLQVRLPVGTLLLHDGAIVGLVRRTNFFEVSGPRKRGEAPLVKVYTRYGAVVLKPELPDEP